MDSTWPSDEAEAFHYVKKWSSDEKEAFRYYLPFWIAAIFFVRSRTNSLLHFSPSSEDIAGKIEGFSNDKDFDESR